MGRSPFGIATCLGQLISNLRIQTGFQIPDLLPGFSFVFCLASVLALPLGAPQFLRPGSRLRSAPADFPDSVSWLQPVAHPVTELPWLDTRLRTLGSPTMVPFPAVPGASIRFAQRTFLTSAPELLSSSPCLHRLADSRLHLPASLESSACSCSRFPTRSACWVYRFLPPWAALR